MSRFSYNNRPLGLYLHIPFCVKKCAYCDFYSVTDTDLMKDFVTALLMHIREYGRTCSGYTVDTVYIGGGTPTCLGPKYLGRILQEVRGKFPLADDVEITVECNPESTDKKVLDMMKKQGVTRLSFGVQSAQEDELKRIGRIHTFEQAKAAVDLAREKGFDNISLDLMYGLPGQTQEKFLDSVEQCLALGPKHLSCYGLTLEPATPMGRENPVLPDEDAQADTYLAMCELLRMNGFEHYEISNFARPGYACAHNLGYWRQVPYLGLGVGAASMLPGRQSGEAYRRRTNVRDLASYLRQGETGNFAPAEAESITPGEACFETMMLGLRTREGVSERAFMAMHGISLEQMYGQRLTALASRGLMEKHGEWWRLTRRGMDVQNAVLVELMEE